MNRKTAKQNPQPTAAELIAVMVDAGARLQITRGGSLIIGGLGDLPKELQESFLAFDHPPALVGAARAHLSAYQPTSPPVFRGAMPRNDRSGSSRRA